MSLILGSFDLNQPLRANTIMPLKILSRAVNFLLYELFILNLNTKKCEENKHKIWTITMYNMYYLQHDMAMASFSRRILILNITVR